jgi:sugar O-acyltransferase (sialic acid O-acetyltransferase NeuD family)
MLKIYGKGGHAKVINSLVNFITLHEPIEIEQVDDTDYVEDLSSLWIIGIGDNVARKQIAEKLKGSKFTFIAGLRAIVNNLDIMSHVPMVGEGTVIMDGAIVQIGTLIGDHCIINTNANIDHDCRIGNFVHIAPGVTLCGNVTIGDGTFIGAGSTVIPGVTIGKDCIIGAGSVVIRDIPDNSKAYGNPCKLK